MSCQIERYMWEELPQIWFITHFSRYFRRCPKNTDDWWSLSYPKVKFQHFINPCDVLLKMYVKVAWHTYSRNRLCLRGQRRNELLIKVRDNEHCYMSVHLLRYEALFQVIIKWSVFFLSTITHFYYFEYRRNHHVWENRVRKNFSFISLPAL